MRHSLFQGEAPFASHLLYAQPGILDDLKDTERRLGIEAGFTWGFTADLIAVYTDLGYSSGMLAAIEYYMRKGIPIEYRKIGEAQR